MRILAVSYRLIIGLDYAKSRVAYQVTCIAKRRISDRLAEHCKEQENIICHHSSRLASVDTDISIISINSSKS